MLSLGTDLVLSDVERMTLLGFLAAYRGYTRNAYALDLRQFTTWCWQHEHHLFDVDRVDIECFARDLEDRGKARGTVARRLCTIVGFYRYADEEGVIEHSPAVHIRRPRIDYESRVAHLDRNELGALDDVLAALGEPHLVGSAALGLMVRPDLDLTVVCDALVVAALYCAAEWRSSARVTDSVRQLLSCRPVRGGGGLRHRGASVRQVGGVKESLGNHDRQCGGCANLSL